MDCELCGKCNRLDKHEWRIGCRECSCAFYVHRSHLETVLADIGHPGNEGGDMPAWISPEKHPYSRGLNQLADYGKAMAIAANEGLLWLPIGVSNEEVSEFVLLWSSTLPEHRFRLEANEPRNQLDRAVQFVTQLPAWDWHDQFEGEDDVEVESSPELRESRFKKTRDSQNFGFGEVDRVESNTADSEVCAQCKEAILVEHKFAVHITHSATLAWHVGCFQCSGCSAGALVDFHYCWDEGSSRIFCVRHFGELVQGRCGGCDKLIFDKDFTKATDREFHVDHFACHECDKSLTGDRYILRDERPFCLTCFEKRYAHQCDRCHERISYDSKDLSFNDRHWHDKCFFCDSCHASLVNSTFGARENDIFCTGCYEEKFTTRCVACEQPFRSGAKKFEYEGKEWHEQCFVCGLCGSVIGAASFIPRPKPQGGIVCVGCYETKIAQRCSLCTQVIRKGGVTYGGKPWHRECFLCTKCKRELANTKFTSKDDKPYCPDCFTDMFSRRCKKCQKPISGFGGCKYISLDSDNWHTDCFTCTKCTGSLVGKGFLCLNGAIVCPDCYQASGNENNSGPD